MSATGGHCCDSSCADEHPWFHTLSIFESATVCATATVQLQNLLLTYLTTIAQAVLMQLSFTTAAILWLEPYGQWHLSCYLRRNSLINLHVILVFFCETGYIYPAIKTLVSQVSNHHCSRHRPLALYFDSNSFYLS